MPGRIREDDIAEVREKTRIEEVIGDYVTLRNAGGGSLKGLCPFHDEKSPSFNVNPSRQFFHCLAGETRVLTWEGARPIAELAGGTHRILDRFNQWVEAPFKSYGVQRLHRITLSRNRQRKEIYATDGHRWFVRHARDQREALTRDLRPGDRLVTSQPVVEPGERQRARVETPGRASDAGAARVAVAVRGSRHAPARPSRARLDHRTRPAVLGDWVVQSVEATDRVEEVYCAEVETGHAFVLEDNILTGNCFGCQEGGDVFTFLMKNDGLSFSEAVERLADKVGIQLRREDGDVRDDRPKGPPRNRLVEANKAAQAYYAEQLAGPDAVVGRQFLHDRGFDAASAEHFGIGFAPRGGEDLLKHLRGRGYSQDELVAAGLVAVGRSAYDRFRGRLLWPIRDASGATIGFGARRLFDDDRIEAKYLNTPETSLYKKSQVLYGIDLARQSIGKSSQAVVVEGYTDVMACHLSGITTAVASCGTAFGDDHTRVLRRFLHDHEEFRGEVIFTFDGDAAGQAAALKAFAGDQKFVSQTYVAVQPEGLDPCELRIRDGDAAVRDLVASRSPLYRFVLGNIIAKYDLDRADGRIDAVRESARLVASVRDQSKVTAFAQEISRMIGADVDTNVVLSEVRRAAGRGGSEPPPAPAPAPRSAVLDPRHPRFEIERETLKLVLQHPMAIGRTTADIDADDFTHPTLRAVWELVAAAGGPVAGSSDPSWVSRLRDRAVDPSVSAALSALAVEPLKKEPDAAYVTLYVVKLLELTTLRRIAAVKTRLQRTNPVEQAAAYNKMFGELAALEQHRRTLRDRIAGTQ